jgi:hypothetical protein
MTDGSLFVVLRFSLSAEMDLSPDGPLEMAPTHQGIDGEQTRTTILWSGGGLPEVMPFPGRFRN